MFACKYQVNVVTALRKLVFRLQTEERNSLHNRRSPKTGVWGMTLLHDGMFNAYS